MLIRKHQQVLNERKLSYWRYTAMLHCFWSSLISSWPLTSSWESTISTPKMVVILRESLLQSAQNKSWIFETIRDFFTPLRPKQKKRCEWQSWWRPFFFSIFLSWKLKMTNFQVCRWMSGWWLNQPIWKICSSKWESSPNRGENNKYLSCHHLDVLFKQERSQQEKQLALWTQRIYGLCFTLSWLVNLQTHRNRNSWPYDQGLLKLGFP